MHARDDKNIFSFAHSGEKVPIATLPELYDAVFMAHARTDIPALIAEVERLKEIEWMYNDLCK